MLKQARSLTTFKALGSAFLLVLLTGCQSLSEKKVDNGITPETAGTVDMTAPPAKTESSPPEKVTPESIPAPLPVAEPAKPTAVKVATADSKSVDNLIIIGAVEKIQLPEQKISLNARIDTGATTTSINAQNIKKIERDGKKWVRFEIHDETGKVAALQKPVSRVVNIKRHGAEDQNRFAVKLKLKLGKIEEVIEVTLADRKKFTYPLLIGRNFLTDIAIVDVSKEYTIK